LLSMNDGKQVEIAATFVGLVVPGGGYDNAVVESFFASLKRERIKRRKYRTRDQARADVFDYIERFYNHQRRHSYVGNISPVEFEERTVWWTSPDDETRPF
jgi:putative transposase